MKRKTGKIRRLIRRLNIELEKFECDNSNELYDYYLKDKEVLDLRKTYHKKCLEILNIRNQYLKVKINF